MKVVWKYKMFENTHDLYRHKGTDTSGAFFLPNFLRNSLMTIFTAMNCLPLKDVAAN